MKKYIFIFVIILPLVSCRSYYDLVADYHAQLDAGDFKKAEKELLHSKFLKKKRNQILLNLELGKTMHLQQAYDSSNYYFNKADLLMDERSVVADASLSTLANEAVTRYKGEDFERVLIHYYKALNYLYLNKNEDALVEAKRINLRLNELGDKQLFEGKKYKSDAFAHTLQGFVYERLKDYNNAFIAYRNAYELYEKSSELEYMGSKLPEQLKIDLINAAEKAGFGSEREYYCTKFNIDYNTIKERGENELLFIWENGLAPIKQQEDIFLFLVKGAGGALMFSDKSGQTTIPFILPESYKNDSLSFSDLNMVRVAYPKYIDVPVFYIGLTLEIDSQLFHLEPAENIKYIAHENLRERYLKEVAYTVSRIALRQLTIAKLKKENMWVGLAAEITSVLAEKADTRNWQSLPADIFYTRIPVQKGANTLQLHFTDVNGQQHNDTMTYNAKHKLNIINYNTLKHFPPVLTN